VTKLLLLLFSGLKLGKVLITGGSMLLSVAVYAIFFGWPFALGFVLLLFIHELGHYLAARQRGLEVGAMAFIPFVGAWVAIRNLEHDAETEAYVGIAGPVLGTLGALGCYYVARDTGSNLLLALSYSGFLLNLINLIPLSPFDGGRVTQVISPRLWLLGVPILGALFVYHPSPMLVLIGILALPSVMRAWNYDPNAPENLHHGAVSTENKVVYGASYLALAAFLAVMSSDVHEMLSDVAHGYAT